MFKYIIKCFFIAAVHYVIFYALVIKKSVQKLSGAYVYCYMSCRLKINLVLACLVLSKYLDHIANGPEDIIQNN